MPVPFHKRIARSVLHATGYFAARHREWERDVSVDPAQLEPWSDGRPMPPPYLITLVAGRPSQKWYSQHGERQAAMFASLSEAAGLPLSGGVDVLDFGCGCGRIARHIAPLVTEGGGRFHGIDLQRPLVDWCAANLPGTYVMGNPLPPAQMPPSAVDVIYAYSVVTHLKEASTTAWLKEFARLLKPGGLAMITFHDEDFESVALRDRVIEHGYVLTTTKSEGLNHMGSWITRDYFRGLCTPFFSDCQIMPSDRPSTTQAIALLRTPVSTTP